MSYPILYSATETSFDHNGYGILGDCVSCEVTEEANGIFELAMQYPMDGVHFAEIGDRAIIKAKADQFRDPQLFRVYAISKPMNGIVTVLAEHISYDLSGIPVKPFSSESVGFALAGLRNNAVVDCPFDFWTDKSTSGKFSVPKPASIRSRLGGVAGSILDVYGGEYEFDNYTVKLHNNRGMNRGVSIRYGKNLTDIQQEQNCASVSTGVYPYWAGDVDGNTVIVELPERIVNTPGTYNFVKIRTVDFTQNFETQPSVEQLRSATENYIKNNNIGVPTVSLTISFAQLEQSEEYKHLKLLERVSLFDAVNVEFPALKVSATAKAVKIVYDVIADRVKSATLGSVRANIADTIANQQQEISNVSKDKLSVSLVQKISSALAKAIMGANGGAVRLIDTNNDGEPDELYIADNADPNQAVKVWRFNYNGWAASKNGYSGPFEFGATLEDGLLANFVTAAQLVAGTIKSQDDGKTFFLDLDNGVLKGSFEELKIDGKTVDEIAKETANDAVNEQTQMDIFNKLTNNGTVEGIYIKDGQVYINASYLATGILASKDGKTFYLDLDNGILKGQFSDLSISGKTVDSIAQEKANAAESKAISAAACDATAKANAAQSNAISAASADASNKANAALSSANSYANSAASAAVNAQTQMDIFNKLTNNGQIQGLYMQDGQLYVNASYLQSGTLDANLINVINLVANKLTSTAESSTLEIDGAHLNMKLPTGRTFALSNWDLSPEGIGGGDARAIFTERNEQGEAVNHAYITPRFISLGGGDLNDPALLISASENRVELGLPNVDMRTLFWQDNGDGTHTLMGSESADLEGQRYTKFFDLGNVGGTTSNHRSYSFEHGIPSNYKIVKCEGYTTGSNATTLPTIQGGLVTLWADKTKVYLYREIAYTPPADERLYVQVWYTE